MRIKIIGEFENDLVGGQPNLHRRVEAGPISRSKGVSGRDHAGQHAIEFGRNGN